MKFVCVVFFMAVAITLAKQCSNRRTNSKLICYYSDVKDINTCMCTHIILPANSDAETINSVQEKFKGGQVLLTATELNEDLVNVLKNSKVDGLEINLKKLDDKNDVPDFISTIKSKLGSDLLFTVSIPTRAEHLAKYYDLKALTKHADFFILQTAFLGASQNVTFHPSRLSGLWDMQNIDSVVDLVSGMGAPLSKLVITAPVQAFQFTLQDESYTAPGSPALEIKSLTRQQLCNAMSRGSNWTLERDEDQAGPYIFRKNTWIAFDDAISMDIKAKYTRVRGLAGLALKDLTQDGGDKCGGTLLEAAHSGLSKQSRAPRGAVLQSLEREILDTPSRPLDTIQISPYRISRVIDVEGNVHSIRQDTRTEFECARQGYFVHPRSCGRFYRCVKFDQLADDFSVFEFDCPAGLSFDSRYEVCVWPGSLPYSSACSGSSEIAPVPRTRFVCPQIEGYYADPENCRWFFACLDHGKSPLSAYEFRCPFGLVFDESRLVCEWPWAVPKCGSGSAAGFEYSTHLSHGAARLNAYDGLGALGVVGLGGLSGTLIQPQAKVYTNAAHGAIGSQGELHTNYGYTQTLAGIGIKQGTLDSSQIGSSGVSGHRFSTLHGKYSGTGLVNSDGKVGSSFSLDSFYPGHITNQYNHGVAQSPTYNSEGVILQQQAFGALGNLEGFAHSKQDHSQEVKGASYQTNIDFGSSLPTNGNLIKNNVAGNTGTKTASFINHGITHQLLSSGVTGNHQTHFDQSLAAVRTNDRGQGITHSVVPVENVHIVGGFSAVGTGGAANVDIDQNNVNINNVGQVVHATPISTFSIALPSPVPAVAAAPVPVVKSDTNAYEGGVVANVPELQYKIVTPSASNVYFQSNFNDNTDYALSRAVFGVANISQNHVNYISSTPAPIALSTVSYEYKTPLSAFRQTSVVEPLVSFNQQHTVHEGYSYPKPATVFGKQPIQVVTPATVSSFSFAKNSFVDKSSAINGYATATTSVPIQVSRFSINNAQESVVHQPNIAPNAHRGEYKNIQTVHVQPIITPTIIEHKPQPAIVSSFRFENLNKPDISVIPSIHSKEPAVVSSYSFENSFGSKQNYNYQKPSVVFGEKTYYSSQPAATLVNVESSDRRATSLDSGAVYSGTKFSEHTNQGSTYNNEGVSQQQIFGFSNNHGATAIKYNNQRQDGIHGASYQTNIDYGQKIPAEVSTFSVNNLHKPQSVVSVTPVVPVIQHRIVPQVISVTPTVETAVHNLHAEFESKRYNYQNQNIFKDEGYQYPKPVLAFNNVQPTVVSSFSIHSAEQPLINLHPTVQKVQQNLQPGIVSSYSFQNIGHNDYQNSNSAVSVNKQSAVGLAQTVPIVQQTINRIQPAITSDFHNLTRNGNYGYFKSIVPVQPVVSVTPVTTIVKESLQQQPAVVSSYNYQNVLHNKVYQVAPVISVTETVPIIQHRVKPLQPTIISSYSFQNEANTEGYKYAKQIPLQPLQPISSVSETVPIIQHKVKPLQPTIISSYSFQNEANTEGYKYAKQIPLQPLQPTIISSYSFQNEANTERYKYGKQIPLQPLQPISSVTASVRTIQNNLQPAVVSSYSFNSLANNDHQFFKQTVPLQPIVSVNPTVSIPQSTIQPAVVSSFSFQNLANNDYYKSTKQVVQLQPIASVTPAAPIIENKFVQPATVSSYHYQVSNNREYNKQTAPVQTIQPVENVHKNVHSAQPSIASSYAFQNSAKSDNSEYSKQVFKLAQPISSVSTVNIPVQPVAAYGFNNNAKPTSPTLVSSFNIKSIENDDFNQGYVYRKPSIAFEERPSQPIASEVSVTPIVPVYRKNIQTFTNAQQVIPTQSTAFNYDYTNSGVVFGNGVHYSINNEITAVKPQGFRYSTPFAAFGEKSRKSFAAATPAPTIFTVTTPIVPIIKQRVNTVAPVIVQQQNEKLFNAKGNFGQKISVSTTQSPIIIEDTIISKQEITIKHRQPTDFNVKDNADKKPVEEIPFVAKKAYITGKEQNQGGYDYPKPAIRFEEGASFAVSPVTTKYKPSTVLPTGSRGKVSFTAPPSYVNDYSYTTPRSNIYVSTPGSVFTTSKSRSRINLNVQNSRLSVTTPKPSYTSTLATVLATKSKSLSELDYNSGLNSNLATFASTENSQFGRKYSEGSIDNKYYFTTSTPYSTYTRKYQDDFTIVSTSKPQSYLPPKIDNGQYVINSKQSAPLLKPKTYIRVNDFHPLLPAKLGAQCTCTSRTLTLRRKPIVATSSAYDATNDDGYFVKPNNNQNFDNLSTRQQNIGSIVEDYAYEPRKVTEASPLPLYIHSTTNTILPAPSPAFIVRKRVRVGQVTTPSTLYSSAIPFVQVTQAPELILKKTSTPVVGIYNEEILRNSPPSNYNNLAKATAKETYTDKSFDRYGPGGWRSRQETLQGTVDCQRAGLFRHPEQCNKFYTCRWDCTKKRFTLHVFNCPVHLTFDSNLGACNWPSQGPACAGNTLLPNE